MDGIRGMSARPGTDRADRVLFSGQQAARDALPRKIATDRGIVPAERAVTPRETSEDQPTATGLQGQKEAVPPGLHKSEDRVAFSLPEQMRKAAAAVTPANEKNATTEPRQLTFSFYGEIKQETAAAFELKIGRLATENGDSTSVRAAMSLGFQLSASFTLSGTISGEALNGFGNAAELGLTGFDTRDFLDKFIALTAHLMKGNAEDLNEFLSFFGSANTRDSKATLESMVNQLFSRFFGNGNPSKAASVNVSMSMQLEFSFQVSGEFAATAEEAAQSDPLVLDLNGDGKLNLTTVADGARFDLAGTGRTVQAAFVTGGDAFLALDRNGNGQIDSGLELFGDQHGATNGFEELRQFDDNRDGIIDSQDAVFASLRAWRDNGNGISEAGELLSMRDANIAAIRLDYRDVNKIASGGNRVTQVAAYQRVDGRYGLAGDVLLNYLG